jgi:transposase
MDMGDPYVTSTLNHLPEAQSKIVFDKFHIAKHLSEAVDQVRRRENKLLRAQGDDRLAGTRYDWLRHPARMEPDDRKEFAALRDSNLKTARAWALKEAMMAFFEYFYERPARKHYRWWHHWAVRSRLKPIAEKARMIRRRFENIVTYIRHRITNAAVSRSTQRSSGSSTQPAASAIRRTSLPPSVFTAAVSILCRPPTEFPECPKK